MFYGRIEVGRLASRPAARLPWRRVADGHEWRRRVRAYAEGGVRRPIVWVAVRGYRRRMIVGVGVVSVVVLAWLIFRPSRARTD